MMNDDAAEDENLLYNSSSDSDQDIPQGRRTRIFRNRINFCETEVSHNTFLERFRVSPSVVDFLECRLAMHLDHQTHRNMALSARQQILATLHWMGSGSQYHLNADAHGLSTPTIHRCVKKVTMCIANELFGEEVRWPTENVTAIPQQFMRLNNIPRIAGIVDGTLIKLDAPHENEVAYVDRNGNHSINVMLVCGPNLDFFFASARWPGSVHDSRVMRCSSLFSQWENGWRPFPGAVILGDSGYSLRQWLITPNIPAQITMSPAVGRFLRAFKSTRRLVENAIGILKEKFPCLNYLRVQPLTATYIILSCVTLHNLEKRMGSATYESYDVLPDIETADETIEDHDLPSEGSINTLTDLISYFGD